MQQIIVLNFVSDLLYSSIGCMLGVQRLLVLVNETSMSIFTVVCTLRDN
jgi:hypothetical protein